MSFGWGAQVASAGVRTHRLLVPLFKATVGSVAAIELPFSELKKADGGVRIAPPEGVLGTETPPRGSGLSPKL